MSPPVPSAGQVPVRIRRDTDPTPRVMIRSSLLGPQSIDPSTEEISSWELSSANGRGGGSFFSGPALSLSRSIQSGSASINSALNAPRTGKLPARLSNERNRPSCLSDVQSSPGALSNTARLPSPWETRFEGDVPRTRFLTAPSLDRSVYLNEWLAESKGRPLRPSVPAFNGRIALVGTPLTEVQMRDLVDEASNEADTSSFETETSGFESAGEGPSNAPVSNRRQDLPYYESASDDSDASIFSGRVGQRVPLHRGRDQDAKKAGQKAEIMIVANARRGKARADKAPVRHKKDWNWAREEPEFKSLTQLMPGTDTSRSASRGTGTGSRSSSAVSSSEDLMFHLSDH